MTGGGENAILWGMRHDKTSAAIEAALNELKEADGVSVERPSGITILEEGVRQNADATFMFDFTHDDSSDIVYLTNPTVYQSTLQSIPYYYFAYKFNDSVQSKTRTEFIHHLKVEAPTPEKERFVRDAITKFNSMVPVQQFEYIVYPQSASPLTWHIVEELCRVVLPEFSIGTIEMTKTMPQNIGFDYDRYEFHLRNATNPDGTKKYGSDHLIQAALASAKEQMDKIHALDYFSIARNIKGKYKQFLERYYQFKTEKDAKIYKAIESGKVLVVDDILTSGTTLFQLFKALKTVNPAITPTVFTLLGKGLEG